MLCVCAEIPSFLSERECAVVMSLAQLKGLVESQVMVPEGQEELSQQLNLSAEEIFHLLDLNRDGQLQPHEVCVSTSVYQFEPVCDRVDTKDAMFIFEKICYLPAVPVADFNTFQSERRYLDDS